MSGDSSGVDSYIDSFPDDVQVIIRRVRAALTSEVPRAGETISYRIPTITLDGRSLVYFAGWKHHVGVYPVPPTDEPLEQEIAPYRAAKDSLRFPYDEPVPYDLIARVAALLVARRADGTG